jgi:hypothetical protein
MSRILIVVLLSFAFIVPMAHAEAGENSCWFLRDSEQNTPQINFPSDIRSVLIDNYFRIFYSAADKRFSAVDESGLPLILARKKNLFERAHHFLQIELGWKLPVSHVEVGHPELYVYLVQAPQEFQATVLRRPETTIVFNNNVLSAQDLPAILIHEFAHAAELQYKTAGDYWFFEATAGWMEGQFDVYSARTQRAINERLAHPGVSIIDSSPRFALGSARFLDFLARPYRDIIRQIWERWSTANQETLPQIIQDALSVNHLPDFASYLQNYFLLSNEDGNYDDGALITLHPYSATVIEGAPSQAEGGLHLLFTPSGSANYSASLLFYGIQQKQGTLAMRSGLNEPWSIAVPFAGLDHYKAVIVNPSSAELHGSIHRVLDNTIPAVLEYFRVSPGDGGMQIEWKTSKENGVAFWNLYSIRNGQKQLLNDFPIPASIQSDEGIHYLYFDTSAGALYSLEAITSDGFRSPLAGAEKPE